MNKYLLDTNIFIEAHNRYYHKSIVPNFWCFLQKDEDIYTIKEVKEEVKKKADGINELIEDVNLYDNEHFEDDGIANFIEKNYDDSEEKNNFLKKADYLLVCIAKQNNLIVVTQEALVGKNSKKIKIPNICRQFGIDYKDTFQMLKEKNINLSTYP